MNITANVQGHTLDEFVKLIRTRSEWMKNETIPNSAVAAMEWALESVRAKTRAASLTVKTKVEKVEHLYVSFDSHKRYPCLRFKNSVNSKFEINHPDRLVFVGPQNVKEEFKKVYKWSDFNPDGSFRGNVYIVCVGGISMAKNYAKKLVQSRIKRYRGLAQRCITFLRKKLQTLKKDNDKYKSLRIDSLADKVTRTHESTGNGMYTLEIWDNLKYAQAALIGGPAQLDLCFKRSMNKTVSVVNKACKKMFFFERIPTPYPQLLKRKNK